MASLRYTVVLEPEEGGGCHVYGPPLPGGDSFGETTEEALANIRDAIEGYLEILTKPAAGRVRRSESVAQVRTLRPLEPVKE